MSSPNERAGIIPAALSFLAIYNPSFSRKDDSLHEQILYYYSKSGHDRRKAQQNGNNGEAEESKEERNEQLRQIGLAQGMIGFAKNFSNGEPVDSIETEKCRIILHKLEPDWWVLASVNLTRLPSSSDTTANQLQKPAIPIEYSAREVCPPALLLQQIVRAHQIFLLHHAPSVAELYVRNERSKFCGFLKRFWDGFIRNWDVLLHGNPAVDIFNGLKLAAGGELGMGEGEEEWGSGEREVLEGFIEKSPGLVDLLVSRFGDAPHSSRTPGTKPSVRAENSLNWQDSQQYPGPSDGIVFSGIGALTRSSAKCISSWTEWLHMYGQDAYGVRENPSSVPRQRRRKIEPTSLKLAHAEKTTHTQQNRVIISPGKSTEETTQRSNGTPTGIPPPIIAPGKNHQAQDMTPTTKAAQSSTETKQRDAEEKGESHGNGTETLVKYLTLGVYGSSWGIPSGRPPINQRVSNLRGDGGDHKSQSSGPNHGRAQNSDTSSGYFLIGLQGQLEEDVQVISDEEDMEVSTDADNALEHRSDLNNRIIVRTLHVERTKQKSLDPGRGPFANAKVMEEVYYDRLRVVVYVQPPFIFTFLFELQTDSLEIPSFYRSLHHQLGPLQRPLAMSTSPRKVSARLWEAASPKSTVATKNSQPIWDLVYDPVRLTVHTTIPNIPDRPDTAATTSETLMSEVPSWTRIEALSVHSQVLNTFTSTRRRVSELETTCKTSRGWWVVWMRLPHTVLTPSSHENKFREAFLIRKASDYIMPTTKKPTGRGRDVSGSSVIGGWGPGKLAEGIGIDARQYIEGILSLNR